MVQKVRVVRREAPELHWEPHSSQMQLTGCSGLYFLEVVPDGVVAVQLQLLVLLMGFRLVFAHLRGSGPTLADRSQRAAALSLQYICRIS